MSPHPSSVSFNGVSFQLILCVQYDQFSPWGNLNYAYFLGVTLNLASKEIFLSFFIVTFTLILFILSKNKIQQLSLSKHKVQQLFHFHSHTHISFLFIYIYTHIPKFHFLSLYTHNMEWFRYVLLWYTLSVFYYRFFFFF